MRRYRLLTTTDIIPNNKYYAIVYYHFSSPNRNPSIELVYYDEHKQWCGTDKIIMEIVDESIISVLQKENPTRADEIIKGGYIEDGRYNDLISQYTTLFEFER